MDAGCKTRFFFRSWMISAMIDFFQLLHYSATSLLVVHGVWGPSSPSSPFHHIYQRQKYGDFDKRTDSRGQGLVAVYPESRDGTGNGQFKVIACTVKLWVQDSRYPKPHRRITRKVTMK